MPASDDDREMMARFNDTFRKLKTNREQVPLEVLQTKYGKAYQKLTKEMADLADWFAARLRERMPFPMHPKDIAGNRQLSQQIAAVLAEESQPGALMDQYRKALIDDLDYDKFLDLVWQLYHRTEEAYEPYWQKYNFWHVYPDGHRWIRNHITRILLAERPAAGKRFGFIHQRGRLLDGLQRRVPRRSLSPSHQRRQDMDKEELIARFEAEMAKVKRPGIDKLMDYIRKSDFYTAPASTKFHLSCESGLLQHSLNVLDALRGLLQEEQTNEDGTKAWFYTVAGTSVAQVKDESVILIALLHDICKTYFYSTSTRNVKNEKTGKWEKVPFYTVNDLMPLGHGPKSAMLIKNYIKLTSEEMYAIWWHMGFTDQHTDTMSLAAAIQKYPIVWALHTADMMASNFMEDKDGNKKGFEWQELGAENSSNSTGQYADNPALPSDSDEPVFMEAAPC